MRIGIPSNAFEFAAGNIDPAVVTAFNAAIDVLQKAGGAITIHESSFNSASGLQGNGFRSHYYKGQGKTLADKEYSNVQNLFDLESHTQSNPLEDYPSRNTLV